MPFKKSIAAVALFISAVSIAQENYTVKMSFKMEGLPPEYAAMGEQDIVTYIKGDKLKTEMTSMMRSSITYYDGKSMTSLNDAMGTKSGFTATKEELEAMDKEKPQAKPTIEYTSEKKQIAGYECTKAVATSLDKEKKETKTILWVTDKIKANTSGASKARNRGNMDLSELKGYPLGMEMSMNNQGMDMKIVMMATEVTTASLDDALFVPKTEGYTMMPYKEFIATQKAKGGR